jgi:phosphogluconate dehydratase
MDCVVVLPFQGAGANGMPELHKLIPALTVLQNRGFKVALITDGRMSGASGKVPAAIHISPEAQKGGLIGKISDYDMVTLDCNNGTIMVQSIFSNHTIPTKNHQGFGREMFDIYRQTVSSAADGASIFKF